MSHWDRLPVWLRRYIAELLGAALGAVAGGRVGSLIGFLAIVGGHVWGRPAPSRGGDPIDVWAAGTVQISCLVAAGLLGGFGGGYWGHLLLPRRLGLEREDDAAT